MLIVQVVLDLPLDKPFDYLAEGADERDIGARVLVPFGARKRVGVIVAIRRRSELDDSRLKPVAAILRDCRPYSPSDLGLLRFCSEYYHHPLGQVLLGALPPRLRSAKPLSPASIEGYALTPAGTALATQGLEKRAPLRHRVLRILLESGPLPAAELKRRVPGAGRTIKALLAEGHVEACSQHPSAAQQPSDAAAARLNEEQARALGRVEESFGSFRVWLLHGVTGSGKTEVYLGLIHRVLARGGQVLVLVPEINLTPQLEALLRARFPHIAQVSLHSHLSEAERARCWRQAQCGEARLVLGTRLAVFTPLPKLALIVVDEEHDSSFKQQEGLRYSARDVAIFRAKQLGIPVVLGSATPSLESYRNALTGRYGLLELTRRAPGAAALPRIGLIDCRRTPSTEGLSRPLLEAIAQRLERGEQSLVFVNRRGFAPALVCYQCGWASGCPRCSARLVLHLKSRSLRCHHCGHGARPPAACPECGNADLKPVGQGTQRLEAALAGYFPGARILRVDRDSMAGKKALPAMLQQVRELEVDILVGTQMLAKGHDFPRLSLVGVVNTDAALFSTDFRAEEKLFSQLLQVAGRAGRAEIPGEVLIQTRFPHHPLFHALLRHDYAVFARRQLRQRQQAGFPPFRFQALLRVDSTKSELARGFAERAARLAAPLAREVRVFDPVPGALARVAGRYRFQLMVQAARRGPLHAFLHEWRLALVQEPGPSVRWALDVDPSDL